MIPPTRKDRGFARARRSVAAFLGTLALIAAGSSVAEQQRPREDVTVTLVEVPVRVLVKGAPVRDLIQEDFEIFENGVRQDISRFERISRAIDASGGTGQAAAEPGTRVSPRLFLLIFNVFDYEDAVGEAIDHFFGTIFRQGDRIMVLVEDRVLNIERGAGIDDVVIGIKEALKTFKSISTAAAVKAFRDVGHESDLLLAKIREDRGMDSLDQAMIRFFESYERAWEAYRAQFLDPDVDFYRGLIRRIKGVEGEKWAICFQQREMFPRIKNASRLDNEIRNWADSQVEPQLQVKARLVQARYADLQRSFDLSTRVPYAVLSDLFLSADITFHLILMRSARVIFSQDFTLREVGQDYENSLKDISRSTGGLAAFSNQPVETLKQAAAVEDFHYLLVYAPRETSARKAREIRVKVARPGVDVVHLKNFVEAGPPSVAIADVKAGRKAVSFTLRDYQMTVIDNKRIGAVAVKLTLFDQASNKVFDEGRTLELFKDETHITLNFDRLGAGGYFLIIEVFDKRSGLSDVYSGPINL